MQQIKYLFITFALCCLPALAQQDQGNITGTVTDSTGASPQIEAGGKK